jgi:hypothetical protein
MVAKMAAALRKPAWTMVLLFVGLFVAYNADWTAVEEGDAIASMNLPLALVRHGQFSFDSEEFPMLFSWQSSPPLYETAEFYVRYWDVEIGEKTADQWRQEGKLEFNGPRYNLVLSPTKHVFVNTFGPIPGLLLVPVIAVVNRLDPDFGHQFEKMLTVAKLQASALVALSAVFLYWAALGLTSRRNALIVALTFGLGTCAWSIASQNIWQQTASIFFVVLGIAPFVRAPDDPWSTLVSGLGLGAAFACRPTSVVLVLAVIVYRYLHHKKSLAPFVAGLLPFPIVIALYNYRFFGNPFVIAQALVGHTMARAKTGSPNLWQTSFVEGFVGLVASPSRGVLIFSPVLFFSVLGIRRVWRGETLPTLKPLLFGMVWTMGTQCKWFDWWGGWAYGYRPWLDSMPLLCLFLIPVLDDVMKVKWQRLAFSVSLAWSAAVQFVGAFTYDKSWNDRQIFVARLPAVAKPYSFLTEEEAHAFVEKNNGSYIGPSYCNVDFTFCRHRLWSFADNEILYYVRNYRITRSRRARMTL